MVAMDIFDRFLFAYTVGSHIILVTMSISLIVLICIAEFIGIRKNDQNYTALANRLTKVFVISFGVGTASGIVMAVEMVNLFPVFMTLVSETGVISLFYAEVFAFFLETIALVLYVYYRNAFRGKYTHWILSLFVALGTIGSAVFITMVNSWMNSPNGFNIQQFISTGQVTGVQPYAPFLTATTGAQVFHVVTTTVFTGTMAIAGYLSYKYLKSANDTEKAFYSKGVKLSWAVAIVGIILSGISGSHEMATLLQFQPLKYAAMDLNLVPGSNMPETLFGFLQNGQVVWGLKIPGVQSLLAGLETSISTLPGLSQFPQSQWPPLMIHTSFDIMVTGGLLLGLYSFILVVLWILKKPMFSYKNLLRIQILAAFFSFIVYELGWMTDEVGRQPWIVYNVMLTNSATNLTPSLLLPGLFIVAFYLVIIPVTFYFFFRVFNTHTVEQDLKTPSHSGGVNY